MTDDLCTSVREQHLFAYNTAMSQRHAPVCRTFFQRVGSSIGLWGSEPNEQLRYNPSRAPLFITHDPNARYKPTHDWSLDGRGRRLPDPEHGLLPTMRYMVDALQRSGAESTLHELHLAYTEGLAAIKQATP